MVGISRILCAELTQTSEAMSRIIESKSDLWVISEGYVIGEGSKWRFHRMFEDCRVRKGCI